MVQTRAANKRTEVVRVPSNNGELMDDTEFEPSERDEDLPPAKKRRRNGAASPKKRRGKERSELCKLNLDVLFLIAAYICPIDLLSLSRACKSIQVLLMDKSLDSIWKVARRQVPGLPDCPADLTECEYAHLAFSPLCHGCGKRTQTILWKMRRRYCSRCKIKRLCSISSCHKIIRSRKVLANERVTGRLLVDREQADSFMNEYNRFSDKKRFLSDKKEQYSALCEQATLCEQWKQGLESDHRLELLSRRQQRESCIFARLEEHGYEREISYFGRRAIQESRPSSFNTSTLLTDKAWARILPEWIETMDNFRYQRLENIFFRRRRASLATEFASYVANPPLNTPAFEILPHAADIARFPPFRDIIYVLEEPDRTSAKLFESAFAQLPEFVGKWRKELETQLAELVKIPSDICLKDTVEGQAVASGSTTHGTESLQTATGKLGLACAVFHTCSAFMYPEVLSFMYLDLNCGYTLNYEVLPIEKRFKIEFLKDAPYVVHACGLDPNVATVEDMDRLNARVKCLSCRSRFVGGSRDAMQHAALCHNKWRLSHIGGLQWRVIGEELNDVVQAAEMSLEIKNRVCHTRCLLCRPYVGDAGDHQKTLQHLYFCHKIKFDDIKEGIHYIVLNPFHVGRTLEMIEKDGQATFKKPTYLLNPWR